MSKDCRSKYLFSDGWDAEECSAWIMNVYAPVHDAKQLFSHDIFINSVLSFLLLVARDNDEYM